MLGCSSSVTKKRDQAKNKALQIYFRKLFRYLNTRNFNIDLFSVWDSVHYPTQILLTVPPESVRAYVNVITKFSGIDRFPFSAAMELRCLEARGKFGKHSRGLRVAL